MASRDHRARPMALIRAGELAVPLVITAGSALVLLAAWRMELPPPVLIAIATAPLALVVTYRWALPILAVALLARVLVDDSGNQLLTGGVAVALIGLGAVVLWRCPTWIWPVLLTAVYLFVSAWAGAATHGGDYTYAEALRLLSCFAVVVVAVNAPGARSVRRTAATVQAIGVVPAIFAVYQFATGTGTLNNGVLRASGTLAHENSAAMLFALCNLASFALLLSSRRRRWLHAGLLGLFLAAQLATGSIGGLVAAVVMILVYLSSAAVRRADRTLLGVMGVCLGIYVATTSRIGAERLAEYSGSNTEETSLEWRINAWGTVLDAWRSNPWWGNGIGSTSSPTILGGNIPHNEYVRLLAELGVIGLAAVIVLAILLARSLVRAMHSSAHPQAAALALAALVGTAVNALAANTLLYSVSFYVTLFVLGTCWRILHPLPVEAGEDAAPIGGRSVTDQCRLAPSR